MYKNKKSVKLTRNLKRGAGKFDDQKSCAHNIRKARKAKFASERTPNSGFTKEWGKLIVFRVVGKMSFD